MQQGDRGVGHAGARAPVADLARDHADQGPAVRRAEQRDLACPDVLVAGVGHLEPGRQVHPQLEAVEQPAADHQLLGRLLDVQDAAAGGHPLGVAVGDQAAAAVGVLVPERPVDDVGHGLEPAVRVPGRALRLTGRVVHLAHLVHVNERVQRPQVDAGECAADRETLALEKPEGAVVTARTWRSRATAGSGSEIRGSSRMSLTVTAGMAPPQRAPGPCASEPTRRQ